MKSFDRICEVQSDKATVEITSRFDGKIVKIHHEEGAIVKVGAALLDIHTGNGTVADHKPEAAATPEPLATTKHVPSDSVIPSDKVLTTPAVRKIAKENKVNLSAVRPTGPKGRITKEDILNHIQGKTSSAPTTFAPARGADSKPAAHVEKEVHAAPVHHAPSAEDVRVPIRGVQRLMVKSMTAANQVKHLTLCEEITFDKIKQLRKELKGPLSKQGIKLSYMPLIIKATSLALLQYPMLNATVNGDVTEMIHHHNHNIGVAMDTPKGLVVPVIKHVQNKSIVEIARELNQLQEVALKGALTEAHLQGGTFSLSNIGSVGGTYAVPVIVVPQVAIGAFGRLQVVPRYMDKDGNPASVEDIEE